MTKCFDGADFPLVLRGRNWSVSGAGGIPLPLTRLSLSNCSGVDGRKAPAALVNGCLSRDSKKIKYSHSEVFSSDVD